MSEKKENNSEIKIKSVKYPVIYSYIYEREKEDIIRLSSKFKRVKKSIVNDKTNKIVTGFEIVDGIAKPIYADRLNRNIRNTTDAHLVAIVSEGGVVGEIDVNVSKNVIKGKNVSTAKGKSSNQNKK